MVIVNISTNAVHHDPAFVDEMTTVRTVLESNGINYSRGITALDGSPLGPGDMDKTFHDFGITQECWLTNVVKADNA